MDRGAWQAMVYRVAKSWAQLKQLSTHAQLYVQLPIFYVLKPQNSLDNQVLTSHQSPTYSNVAKKTKELLKFNKNSDEIFAFSNNTSKFP